MRVYTPSEADEMAPAVRFGARVSNRRVEAGYTNVDDAREALQDLKRAVSRSLFREGVNCICGARTRGIDRLGTKMSELYKGYEEEEPWSHGRE